VGGLPAIVVDDHRIQHLRDQARLRELGDLCCGQFRDAGAEQPAAYSARAPSGIRARAAEYARFSRPLRPHLSPPRVGGSLPL
jgi:hypothetical protein